MRMSSKKEQLKNLIETTGKVIRNPRLVNDAEFKRRKDICNTCRYDKKKKEDWVVEGPSKINRQSVISQNHYNNLNELKLKALKKQKALGFMDINKRP